MCIRDRVSHSHRGIETMPVADVRCLLAEQKYVTACAPRAELLIPDTLKELEREFGEVFLRVHRPRRSLMRPPFAARFRATAA